MIYFRILTSCEMNPHNLTTKTIKDKSLAWMLLIIATVPMAIGTVAMKLTENPFWRFFWNKKVTKSILTYNFFK